MNLIGYDGQIELEEDDWADDYDLDDDDDDKYSELDDDDAWECEFGAACLMPSFVHRASECYTVEMAEAWQDEQMREVS